MRDSLLSSVRFADLIVMPFVLHNLLVTINVQHSIFKDATFLSFVAGYVKKACQLRDGQIIKHDTEHIASTM